MQVDNNIYFALVEEQLSNGLCVTLTLNGTSMTPTIHPGDRIVLAPASQAPVKDDVVLFRYNGRHLLHRIIAVDDDGTYTLQGDHCCTTEHCHLDDIVGILVEANGVVTTSAKWRMISRRSLCRKRIRNTAIRWFGRQGRRQFRPWYLVLLAFLMWAPLNGLDVPLNNYFLGLRADHLVHAMVFLPCGLFFVDLFGSRLVTWLVSVAVGLTTEWVQYLLPWRGFDVNDLVANVLGITIGCIIVFWALRRRP